MTTARYTSAERSRCFAIAIMPTTKPATLQAPASSPGIARVKLLKKLSPPLWPAIIKTYNTNKETKKAPINLTDHFPIFVCGIVLKLTN